MSHSRPPRTPFATVYPSAGPAPGDDRVAWDPTRGVHIIRLSPQGRLHRAAALAAVPRLSRAQRATAARYQALADRPADPVQVLANGPAATLRRLVRAWSRRWRAEAIRPAAIRRAIRPETVQ